MTVELIGTVFAGRGRHGDFAWMIERPEHSGDLFVFNDDEEHFRAFRASGPGDAGALSGCEPGGGNAVIRPRRCDDPPRAAGIPTGAGGAGFDTLTPEVQALLDEALGVVRDLLATGRYRRVFYSAEDESGALGTGIFTVGDGVKAYIVAGLRVLASAKATGGKPWTGRP